MIKELSSDLNELPKGLHKDYLFKIKEDNRYFALTTKEGSSVLAVATTDKNLNIISHGSPAYIMNTEDKHKYQEELLDEINKLRHYRNEVRKHLKGTGTLKEEQ